MWFFLAIGPAVMLPGEASRGLIEKASGPVAPIGFCLSLFMIAQCWLVRRPCLPFESTHPLSRDEMQTAVSRAIGRQCAVAFVPMVAWTCLLYGVVASVHAGASPWAFPLQIALLASVCMFVAGAVQWLVTEHRLWLRMLTGLTLAYFMVGLVVVVSLLMLTPAPGVIAGFDDLIRIVTVLVLALGGWGFAVWPACGGVEPNGGW